MAAPASLIASLPDEVALAREYAVLGAYAAALQHYERATQTVARYLRALVDSGDRGKWGRMREDLAAEASLVRELVRELAHFRRPPGAAAAGDAGEGDDEVGDGDGVGGDEAAGGEATEDGGAAAAPIEFEDDPFDSGAGSQRDGGRSGRRSVGSASSAAMGSGSGSARRSVGSSGVAGAGRARGRGPAFNLGGDSAAYDGDDGEGDAKDSDIADGDDAGGGGGKGGGRWSPPPPRARAASVGPARGADVPAWERHAPPPRLGQAGKGAGGRPSVGSGRSLLDKVAGAGSSAAAAVVGAGGGAGRPPKQVLKAPLPMQAKLAPQPQLRGVGAGAGAGAGAAGSGQSAAAAAAAARGGGAKPPSGQSAGADNGTFASASSSASAPRPKYTEVHRGAVDQELIERLEREMLDLAPNVTWGDIAGLDDAKGVLQEAVVLPMMLRNFFSGVRKPWKGVLLYGPPGTGKTLLAKAVATECRTTFFNVSASSLASKWRGDGEKLVRILFDMAKYYAPTVVFFDEVDSIASRRSDGEQDASRRMKTEMLVCMDGISNDGGGGGSGGGGSRDSGGADGGGDDGDEGGEGSEAAPGSRMVMVLGATNQPWELDDAFKRRFEKRIYIPLPGPEERKTLLRLCLRDIRLADGTDTDALATLLDNYSGADIAIVCKHAAYAPMRHKQAEVNKRFPRADQMRDRVLAIQAAELEIMRAGITQADFEEAIAANKPSASGANLKHFEDYARDHGSA